MKRGKIERRVVAIVRIGLFKMICLCNVVCCVCILFCAEVERVERRL